MHESQVNFCKSVKDQFPLYFMNIRVLDCGSLNINGTNRYLFTNCEYIGIDVGAGPNVDYVTPIHEFQYPSQNFDTIISSECFEHDMYYKESLKNIVRLLKPNGLFLFTCATTGRPEHGTLASKPQDSPFTVQKGTWATYYKNLEERDIREAIDVDDIFRAYSFSTNKEPADLYFWGIKK